MLRKLKLQIPVERLATRYNWCQGPVPGGGPAVERQWRRVFLQLLINSTAQSCISLVLYVLWTYDARKLKYKMDKHINALTNNL